MKTRKPVPLVERVRASEAKRIASGARPTPRGILPAEASDALDALMGEGYAASATGCIAKALVEAQARRRRR